jgi:FAD/FMN-containing dehydrogenase
VRTLPDLLGERLIHPGRAEYDAARRVWNAAIDRRPALIARCRDATEVAASVRYARERGLPVAVRAGGHSVAGLSVCDGGLVIDLSGLNRVQVTDGLASLGAGLLNGDVDRATLATGQATTTGIVSHTGLAGLLLGGGIGWLMRRYGAACDNLVSAEIVDADGTVVEIDTRHELMYGLRGAGSNFGVVTRLDVRLHPVAAHLLAGVLVYPADRAGEILARYAAWADGAPPELTTIVNLRHAAPLPWLPTHLHGRPVVIVGCCWCGLPAEGERVLGPLRALGPVVDTMAVKPYAEHQRLFDAAVPHGLNYYWRSDFVAALDTGVIEVLAAQAWQMESMRSYTIIFQLGGALAGADQAGAAFPGRTGFAVNINGVAAPPDAPDIEWVRRTWSSLHPHSSGVYVNFLDDEGSGRVEAAYGAALPRLRELKRRYDPDNVFRHNHNIAPSKD